jgi:hypothetical protein
MNKYLSYFLSVLSFFQFVTASSQLKMDGGFFAGVSYYLGDINPNRQFYDVSPSFAALLKFPINLRYDLRAQVTYGSFRANDADFANEYQRARGMSFTNSAFDFSFTGEYNFFPFKYNERRKIASPYLFAGIAYDRIMVSTVGGNGHLSIPFGVGAKYYLQKNVKIGLEWSFRKTFTDDVDGIINPGNEQVNSFFSNKDWYSFTGFFITFGLFQGNKNCPAYQ